MLMLEISSNLTVTPATIPYFSHSSVDVHDLFKSFVCCSDLREGTPFASNSPFLAMHLLIGETL
jgi:hypothetical protein